MEKFGKITSFVLAMVGLGVGYAYTLQHLWAWFVVKALPVHPIGFAVAYGFSLFINLCLPMPVPAKDTTVLTAAILGFVRILLALGFGYVLHFYV
jgi:hypothetical protein